MKKLTGLPKKLSLFHKVAEADWEAVKVSKVELLFGNMAGNLGEKLTQLLC